MEPAFLQAIKYANQRVYVCNQDKVLKPIQSSDFASLLQNREGSNENLLQELNELLSNHLALNFSFAEESNIQRISENYLAVDFDFLNSFVAFLVESGSNHPSLKRALVDGIVSLHCLLCIN